MFIVPFDIQELANRLGAEDPALLSLLDGPQETQESPESGDDPDTRLERLMPLLEEIPPREADMWCLYFLNRKRQEDIADIFQITQAAVSYTIARASWRLRFLARMPRIDLDTLRAILESTPLERTDVAILMTYRETAQQTLTSRRLKITQGRVRHRLLKAGEALERWAAQDRPDLRDVAKLFRGLIENPNILLRVEMPQWRGRGNTVVDQRWAR